MTYLIIGLVLDLGVAIIGVLALILAGRCARARAVIRLAGCGLILYALIAAPWRVWSFLYYENQDPSGPGTMEGSLVDLHQVLAPLRPILGSLLLITAIVFLIVALVIRGRNEFGAAQFHGVAGGGHAPGGDWRAAPHAAGPHHGVPGAPPPGLPGGSPQWGEGSHGGQHGHYGADPGPPAQPGHNPGDAWSQPPSHDWRPAPGTGPQQPPPYPPEDPPAR